MFSTTSGSILLGQVQPEDCVLPSVQQSLHIELGQLQKLALGCKLAAGDQHVDMRQFYADIP
jgi:hypothetical protein